MIEETVVMISRYRGKNLTADNPSKYLLYQDPLLGLFDCHLEDVDTRGYFKHLGNAESYGTVLYE